MLYEQAVVLIVLTFHLSCRAVADWYALNRAVQGRYEAVAIIWARTGLIYSRLFFDIPGPF
jgi:hypothetical protein